MRRRRELPEIPDSTKPVLSTPALPSALLSLADMLEDLVAKLRAGEVKGEVAAMIVTGQDSTQVWRFGCNPLEAAGLFAVAPQMSLNLLPKGA